MVCGLTDYHREPGRRHARTVNPGATWHLMAPPPFTYLQPSSSLATTMNVINLQAANEMAHKYLGLRNLVLISFTEFSKTPKVF